MELELGLKLDRVVDDFSSTEFKIVKDRAGPVFLSSETDFMFILTAHLKGYRKQNIKMDINEDGTLIAIAGEKKVQETVFVDWKMYKKDTEIKGFKKVFRIPDEVILDKIEANFDEDESILTISMPKKVRGIRGTAIEEVTDQSSGPENLQNVVEKIPGNDQTDQKLEISTKTDGVQSAEETKTTEELKNQVHRNDKVHNDAEPSGVKQLVNMDRQEEDRVHEKIQEENEVSPVIKQAEESEPVKTEDKSNGKRCNKMCIPVVAGSALILSFVVFVIQMIRTKHQESKKRN
ncbi:unnamed protein product [Fraxinus pennsylvanica]|uniref:SHSP domain-containing protein n=1 Tax=Fraxinus pennsylvanica TaxID=56036 RepID=A0AAD1Z7S4_9LAMI|nr:unnamed protein product [Fraxinus pennsylvanica]